MTMPTTMPFNIIDEVFTHADDPVEPMTVQVEARAVGELDANRLHVAVGSAISRHAMARARIEPWVDDATGYHWLIDREPQVDPFRTVKIGAEDLATIRATFYSRPISLFESPPLRVLHVRVDGGDLVMVSVHHSASDGIGVLRLLRSIGRAYADLDDPQPDFDPAEARRLAVPTEAPSLSDQLRSGRLEMQRLARLGSLPARLAQQMPATTPGYGFATRSVAMGPLTAAPIRAATEATVNDLLLTAASLAAGRWNERHGAAGDRVVVQMPINARPTEWSREIMANLVITDIVSTTALERADPEQCLRVVAEWTDAVKRRGSGPTLAAMAAVPRSGSAARRSSAGWAKWAATPLAETLVLSNLGRIPDGELGMAVSEVSFSPPGPMPFGLGLGAVTIGDRMQLTFRHRWALWSSDACEAFADELIDALADLTNQ